MLIMLNSSSNFEVISIEFIVIVLTLLIAESDSHLYSQSTQYLGHLDLTLI